MSDEESVRHLAGKYLDALYNGDADLFAEIFHERAALYCFTEATPVIMTLQQYLTLVRGRPSAASRDDRREDEIVSLEIATPTTAHLRVRDLYLPKHFTDELSLAKTADGWKIVAKVWHFTVD